MFSPEAIVFSLIMMKYVKDGKFESEECFNNCIDAICDICKEYQENSSELYRIGFKSGIRDQLLTKYRIKQSKD